MKFSTLPIITFLVVGFSVLDVSVSAKSKNLYHPRKSAKTPQVQKSQTKNAVKPKVPSFSSDKKNPPKPVSNPRAPVELDYKPLPKPLPNLRRVFPKVTVTPKERLQPVAKPTRSSKSADEPNNVPVKRPVEIVSFINNVKLGPRDEEDTETNSGSISLFNFNMASVFNGNSNQGKQETKPNPKPGSKSDRDAVETAPVKKSYQHSVPQDSYEEPHRPHQGSHQSSIEIPSESNSRRYEKAIVETSKSQSVPEKDFEKPRHPTNGNSKISLSIPAGQSLTLTTKNEKKSASSTLLNSLLTILLVLILF